MNFKDYQLKSRRTAVYPKIGEKYVYPLLGLAGESGELIDKLKHVIRDKSRKFTKEDKTEIAKEMGDVLWYLTQLATELGLSLDQIAEENIAKLVSRKKRGVLKARGDNR